MNELYGFSANTLSGDRRPLSEYRGKVVLVVNTASQCGITPQYAGLEALHKKYHPKGLKILGFPCNQFGAQEPGSAEEIGAFCRKNYGVSFQMFEKVDVNGPAAHPLYRWLTQMAQGAKGPEIEWNFAKFLLDRDGNVVKRYAPQTEPEQLVGDLEKLLATR